MGGDTRSMGSFKRSRAGVSIGLDPIEVMVLHQVVTETAQVVAAVDEGEAAASPGQQWARDMGLTGVGPGDAGAGAVPDDPVQARLFPAAYRDDEMAASDFRRFTEGELRAVKSANAQRMLASLPEGGGTVVLDEDGCAAWLGALNDARLALGTALEVDENSAYELAALEASDPRAQRLLVYQWLGELQDSLLTTLMDG